MSQANENSSPGCTHIFAAHSLATYALSVYALLPGQPRGNWLLVALAPIAIPLSCLGGWVASSILQLGMNPTRLVIATFLYVGLFLVARRIVRECQMYPRMTHFVIGILILYLAVAAVRLR